MERWERDSIDRRISRVEEAGRETTERLREFEWRDQQRIHLNMTVLIWVLTGALVVFEIVAAAIGKG